MPVIVHLVRFTDDERAVFDRILSPSILCMHGDDDENRLTLVRRAAKAGEVWNAEQLSRLHDALGGAITDRERTVEELRASDVPGAAGAAEAAAGWLPSLRWANQIVWDTLDLGALSQ